MQRKDSIYKWVIVGACFLMTFFCSGICCGNNSLYLAPITEALGVKRSAYSLTNTFSSVSTAVLSLFFGALALRFGARKLVGFGAAALALSFYLRATTDSIYIFYIGGALAGIGLAMLSTTMVSSIVRRWFSRDLGKIMGLVLSANGLGSAVGAMVLTPILDTPFGYRKIYYFFAASLVAVGILLVVLLKEKPVEELAVSPTETKTVSAPEEAEKGNGRLYFAAVSIFLFFLTIQGIYGVYAAQLRDVSFSAGEIATVASVLTLALTASKFITGLLYDKWGLKVVMLVCQSASVAAFSLLAALAFIPSLPLALLFAVLMAVCMPLETVCVTLILTEFCRKDQFEKNMGIFTTVGSVGTALGAPIMNLCYDGTGTYGPALLISAGVMLALAVGYQWLLARKTK